MLMAVKLMALFCSDLIYCYYYVSNIIIIYCIRKEPPGCFHRKTPPCVQALWLGILGSNPVLRSEDRPILMEVDLTQEILCCTVVKKQIKASTYLRTTRDLLLVINSVRVFFLITILVLTFAGFNCI